MLSQPVELLLDMEVCEATEESLVREKQTKENLEKLLDAKL